MSAESFFSRWAKKKAEAREVVAAPPAVEAVVAPPPPPVEAGRGAGTENPAPPTLEEAQSLTPQEDFTRYVARDVPADVKNTALKKLFTDPHFNQMDGLDVYIDDYGKPDPLPEGMLRQLAGGKVLGLFREEEEKEKAEEAGREVADNPALESVAQSPKAAQEVPPPEDHADPDLRLQQDHAPGPPGPGQGTG